MAILTKTKWVFDLPILDWRCGFSHDVVTVSDVPYLERWILWFGWTLRLHKFYVADDVSRGIHDHPWWFITWVVPWTGAGYYYETRDYAQPTAQQHRIDDIHYSPPDRRHAITWIGHEQWTVVLTGLAKNRDWGFYDREGNFTVHDRPSS